MTAYAERMTFETGYVTLDGRHAFQIFREPHSLLGTIYENGVVTVSESGFKKAAEALWAMQSDKLRQQGCAVVTFPNGGVRIYASYFEASGLFVPRESGCLLFSLIGLLIAKESGVADG